MAVVSTGNGWVPRAPPSASYDVVGATINSYINSGFTMSGAISGTEFAATSGYIGGVYSGYALSGGGGLVGGFWPMQAGSTAITTDGTGQASITFPYAFLNVPTAVVATVNGSDYFPRIVSKATTSFTVKILRPSTSGATGGAMTSLTTSTGTAVISVPTSGGNVRGVGSDWHNDYAAATSGGVAGDSFLAIQSTGVGTFLTAVNATTDFFVKSGITWASGAFQLSGSFPSVFAPLTNTAVQVDWIAAA